MKKKRQFIVMNILCGKYGKKPPKHRYESSLQEIWRKNRQITAMSRLCKKYGEKTPSNHRYCSKYGEKNRQIFVIAVNMEKKTDKSSL